MTKETAIPDNPLFPPEDRMGFAVPVSPAHSLLLLNSYMRTDLLHGIHRHVHRLRDENSAGSPIHHLAGSIAHVVAAWDGIKLFECVGRDTRRRELTFVGGKGLGGAATQEIGFPSGATVRLDCPDWRDWTVMVSGADVALSGRLVSCRADAADVALWYHGGSFSAADTDLVLEQVAMLASGYDLFLPFYPLSADRQFSFNATTTFPDVGDAVREGDAAVAWGHRRYGRIMLVGESFGALLTLPLVAALRDDERAVFVNPFFGTPEAHDRRVDGARLDRVAAGAPAAT